VATRSLIAAALLAIALPAAAQSWRVERKDGVETVRVVSHEGHVAEFLCRRDGPRPGTGSFRIAFRLDRAFPFPTPAAPVELRIANGRETVALTLDAAIERGRRAEPPPDRRRGAARGGTAATFDAAAFAFIQPGTDQAAATLARIAALFADRRARHVEVEAKSLGLAVRFPGGAEREMSGFGKGCLDGIPDPDDEVQGPWHHGISSSDGETVVTLTASADRGTDGQGPQVKLSFACDHGEFSLRIATPGRALPEPFEAMLTTARGTHRLAFTPGPAPEEATAEAAGAQAAWALLIGSERATLSARSLADPPADLIFDVYGLDFAARKMRTLCKGL
jgi:hypothetical protein